MFLSIRYSDKVKHSDKVAIFRESRLDSISAKILLFTGTILIRDDTALP